MFECLLVFWILVDCYYEGEIMSWDVDVLEIEIEDVDGVVDVGVW